MAWWDINFNVDSGAAENWNKIKGSVNALNPFNAPNNTGVFKNFLLPGWGTAGGSINDLWKTVLAPGLESSLFSSGQSLTPIVPTSNTTTDTNDTTEPALATDPNSPQSTESGNTLLRRRKLQNAMKYGFASTIKRNAPATQARPQKSSLSSYYTGKIGGVGGTSKKGGVSIA